MIASLFVIGSERDPLRAEPVAGAFFPSDAENAHELVVSPLPRLAVRTERAFGGALHGMVGDPVVTQCATSGDVGRALWELCQAEWNAGRPVAVWDAPGQLTVVRRYSGEDRPPVGPVVDVKVLDRAFNPRRRGRRTVETTADFYGIDTDPDPETRYSIEAQCAMVADIAEEMANRGHWAHGPQQAAMHAAQTEELAAWATHRRRQTRDLDPAWPVRDAEPATRLDPEEAAWLIVDNWLDGGGTGPHEAAAALRRTGAIRLPEDPGPQREAVTVILAWLDGEAGPGEAAAAFRRLRLLRAPGPPIPPTPRT